MLLIGERINSTRPPAQKAIKARNVSFVVKEASRQIKAGAAVLDVNCAMGLEGELQDMEWVISVLQSEFPDVGVCIDSPNYRAIEAALKTHKGKGQVFINSITADRERAEAILPLALHHNANVIALTMDEQGMPADVKERVAIAEKIIAMAKSAGIKEEALYFDPLVRPVSTEPAQARALLEAIPEIKKLGSVKTICGLSNISFGLPKRSLINSVFLSMALFCGLDACILDPVDKYIESSMKAAQALLGRDEFCTTYISSFREGALI